MGCVLPSGIATDDTTKLFFQDVVERSSLVSLFDFENKLLIFSEVAPVVKFCLFVAGSGLTSATREASFIFFAHQTSDLDDWNRLFRLSMRSSVAQSKHAHLSNFSDKPRRCRASQGCSPTSSCAHAQKESRITTLRPLRSSRACSIRPLTLNTSELVKS